jgi:ubiquitin carboxyl-terminal hydrolase 5/13
LLLIYF